MKTPKSIYQLVQVLFFTGIFLFSLNSCTPEDETLELSEVNELHDAKLLNGGEFDSYALENSSELSSKSDKNKGKSFSEDEGWARGKAIQIELTNFYRYQKDIHQIQNYDVKLMDGKLKGEFEVLDYDVDMNLFQQVKGTILNVVFEDDCKTVRYTGIITDSKFDSDLIGTYAFWTSVDNGVRKHDDETSDIRFGMSEFAAKYHATKGFPSWMFGAGVFQNTAGNVKVESKKCE